MKRTLTSEQMLCRFEDRRDIINLMARYAAGFLLKQEKTMYADYWSKASDITLAFNQGYYVGPAAVQGYYAALGRKNALVAKLIQQKFPEKLGNLSDEEIYGVGTIGYKPLDTGVIEIAGDGRTAKGLWALRGSYTDLTTQGTISYWVWGYMAADFIWEDDAWKLWHLRELYDVHNPCGTSWARGESRTNYPEVPELSPIAEFRLPEPTVKRPVRELYSVDRPFTPAPRLPEPYETFSETFTYGLEGGM